MHHLTNAQYATAAVSSRLLTCIVAESLLQAIYVPAGDPANDFVGLCVILGPDAAASGGPEGFSLSHEDIFAVLPLRTVPVLSPANAEPFSLRSVLLLDPLDMQPFAYGFREGGEGDASKIAHQVLACLQENLRTNTSGTSLVLMDTAALWSSFATSAHVDSQITEQLADELMSCVEWQKYAYDHPAPVPSLASPSIAWEQSLLEGHPTHPMHKARRSLPPMPEITPGSYDFTTPLVRIMSLPRDSLSLRGEFEQIFEAVVKAAEENAGVKLDRDPRFVYMPVHELQVPNVQEKFPQAKILPPEFGVRAQALASTRSLLLPTALPRHSLKLCIGMKISSALRTVSPWTCFVGNEFTQTVLPKLHYDRTLLVVEGEVASAVSNHEDFSIAKHCSTVVRESYELQSEVKGERVIVCAALTEKCEKADADKTLVEHVWGLDTDAKRLAFLERYVKIAVAAFLPPLLMDGVAFEAHGQNTMARFDMKTGELVGFVIRDFGGIKVHQPTLLKSIGTRLRVLPDDAVGTEELNDCFKLLHHTLIHVHIHRLIRVLGLHHDGRGWEIVRRHLDAAIPADHLLRKAWLSEEAAFVPAKCFIKMKLTELYRDYIYSPIPNLIQYKP